MKGARTIAIERKNMKDLVMRMEDMNGDITGGCYAARKLLNRASVERTISKQEVMCLVGQLPLVLCSETLWRKVEDKEIMREHLMERNIEQFSHAGKTPFGYSDLGAELGHTGDSQMANDILEGTLQHACL
jgi:hypothetical protein